MQRKADKDRAVEDKNRSEELQEVRKQRMAAIISLKEKKKQKQEKVEEFKKRMKEEEAQLIKERLE